MWVLEVWKKNPPHNNKFAAPEEVTPYLEAGKRKIVEESGKKERFVEGDDTYTKHERNRKKWERKNPKRAVKVPTVRKKIASKSLARVI